MIANYCLGCKQSLEMTGPKQWRRRMNVILSVRSESVPSQTVGRAPGLNFSSVDERRALHKHPTLESVWLKPSTNTYQGYSTPLCSRARQKASIVLKVRSREVDNKRNFANAVYFYWGELKPSLATAPSADLPTRIRRETLYVVAAFSSNLVASKGLNSFRTMNSIGISRTDFGVSISFPSTTPRLIGSFLSAVDSLMTRTVE
jgi:hypothetical protein